MYAVEIRNRFEALQEDKDEDEKTPGDL